MKKKLNRRFDSSVVKKTPKATTLRLEALESRELLSVAPGSELLAVDAGNISGYQSVADASTAADVVDLSAAMLDGAEAANAEYIPSEGANTITVTSALDVVDASDGIITLREALANAESGDTITFASSLKGKTIELQRGQLTTSASVTIDASNLWNASSDMPGITIDGRQKSRILYIVGNDATIKGVTFTNGYSSNDGGAIYDENGTLSLVNCVISDNRSAQSGGGVYSSSSNETTLELTNCRVTNNHASAQGGGIFVKGCATELTNCRITNNYAQSWGGGISSQSNDSFASISADHCTISDNWASGGGGMCVQSGDGGAWLTNCAITNNTGATDGGGGVMVIATIAFFHSCTIVDNNSYQRVGGGVYVWATPASAYFYNTIIAGNSGAYNQPDVARSSAGVYAYNTLSSYTSWSVGENNLTIDASSASMLFKNAAVGDYTLAANSLAIDNGNAQYVGNDATDLAGNPRIIGSTVDIGAYEYRPGPVQLTTPTNPRETAKTETTVTVAWDAVPNASGYKIAWRNKADSANSYITVDASKTSYKLTGLDAAASYYWKVQALGDGSDYSSSAYTSARTVQPRQKLDAPTLSAVGESTEITVSWNAVPNASRYYVSYKPSNSSTWSSNINVGTNLSYTITGLAANGEYDVRVKAIGDNFDYATSDYGTATVALQNTEPRSTVVTTNLDVVNPADGLISLREALDYANSGATITFASSLRGKTIAVSSPLVVNKSATIDALSLYNSAASLPGVMISGGGSTRIMQIAAGTSVGLKGLTFANGSTDSEGGAILNSGALTVENCVFGGNTSPQPAIDTPESYEAFLPGAAIASVQGGTLAATSSSFVNNDGGSAVSVENGEVSLLSCLISGNSGAGLCVGSGSQASIAFSNVFSNARGGLNVAEGGVLTATNCIVAGNAAHYGGGLELFGTANLYNCTITGNLSYFCGGGVDLDEFAVLNSYNTIIAENFTQYTGADIYSAYGNPVANAYNTLSSYVAWTSGSNNVTYDGSKPLFKDAASGDFTLVNKSQAINKGANQYVLTNYDFAGNPRVDVISGIVDVGAYESLRPSGPIPLDKPVLAVSGKTGTTLTVSWDAVENAERYSFSYRLAGSTAWTSVNVGTNTSYTVNGLTTNANYELQVKAIGDGELYKSVYSDIIVGIPSNGADQLDTPVLTLAGKTDTTISVYWNAVENVEGYRVSYKLATASSWTVGDVVTKTSGLITGLRANANYDLRVEAIGDGVNYESAFSANLRVKTTTTPAAPAPLATPVLTVSDKSSAAITVSWDAIPNVSRYGLSYKLSNSSTWTNVNVGKNTSYTISGVSPNAEYDVRLKAVADGVNYKSVYSPIIRVQTDDGSGPLATPVLTIANKSETTVTVSWNAVPHAKRYSLFYRPSNTSTFTQINLGTETSYTITGLAPDTGYDVRLKAVGDETNYTSSYSAILKVQTNATPDGPVQLTAPVPHVAEKTATTITAAWDAVPNASGYRFIWKNQSDASFSNPIFLDSSMTSYQLTGLDNSATYLWKVFAIGDGVVYLNSEYCATQRDKPQQTLATPTLTLSATATSLKATWTAVPNVERYSLSYRAVGETTWTNVNVGTNRSYTITGLSSGVQYEARVKAIGDGVNYKSVYSTIVRSGSPGSSALLDVDDVAFDELFDEFDEENLDLLAANFAV